MSDVNTLTDLLDDVEEGTNGDQITIGEMLDTIDTRSFGPILLLPAAIALSPIGAIPGMSIVTGTIIILFAGQLLLGRRHPWLPGFIESVEFPRKKLKKTSKEMRPWAKYVDSALHKRLTFLTQRPFDSIVAGICIVLSLLFYPLALVPWGVALPSGAIVLFSLGLTSRDGLFVLVGLILTAISLYLSYTYWPL
ncbi:exopolysaccharide biosynthesis protein [Rubinisphaera sp.]|uniref:exopolysaccharide biosynthesis protein n=1 Tax=Rubinisphaera sp. TaxID=2024857 RepID=UPI000C1026D6|nr:exopolysaccharide biosynthesis protein [Rubinisphaera sp.]MBV10678.1 polysaccharide synthesis protein exod [Rubinisphaera sp.]HCS52430.1 polysaccharide synthesis protein exod [Planctomycetaceae bacterium]|tara:strand:+ start:16902 stop:17483 length:582 start_codon:yes stop_codon:yes gene_type:complete